MSSSPPPEQPRRRRRLEYPPLSPHEAAKARARNAMLEYFRGLPDVFQNNMLITRLLNDMTSFMDSLLINRSIRNREYALFYIMELEHVQVSVEIIQLLRSQAMTLDNTNMLEEDLVGKCYRLERINQMTPWLFEELTNYVANVNEHVILNTISNQLAHYLRLFILALLVNYTRAYIDKTLALEYIYEIRSYLSANSVAELTSAANTLPDTETPFLVNAILLARSSNMLLMQALSSSLSSDSRDDNEEPEVLQAQVTSYISFPANLEMQEQFNRSLTNYYNTLLQYYQNIDDMVDTLLTNARDFVVRIINNVPMNRDLGNRYIGILQDYFTPPAIQYMRNYMNTQTNRTVDTIGLLSNVEVANISHNVISNIRMTDINIARGNRRAKLSKTPLRSIKSIPKTPVMESEGKEYEGVYGRPFTGLVGKLKKIQSRYVRECQDLARIKNVLTVRIDKYRNKKTEITNVDPSYCLAAGYKEWTRLPVRERVRFSLVDLKYRFKVVYKEGAGIGEGVVRDFIQNCVDEMVKYKVFVAIKKDERVLRYVVNEEFVPSEKFIEEMGGEYNKELFYEFVGRLLGLILLNEVGLHFNLSYAVLSTMVYKVEELDSDDLIGCYMLDFPNEFNGYLNLMKKPDDIVYVDLTLANGDAVDKNNFRVWLGEMALGTYRGSLKVLGPGFDPLRKLLREEKVPFTAIDKLITFETVSAEVVKQLIENLNATVPVGVDVMVSILKDKGRTFPFDAIGMEKPSNSNGRQKVFLQFIERLLLFWSSLKHYVPSFSYKISRVMDHSDPTVPLEKRPLPTSHTCFTTIDIPDSYYGNRDMLYRKLVQAVYSVEEGIGLLGGKNKKMNK